MSSKNWLSRLLVAEGHTEPDGALDNLDRAKPESKKLAAARKADADAAAKRARTGDAGNVL